MRVFLWLLLLPGCGLSLDGAACPCTTGWICCNGAQVCVRDGQMCPAADGGTACVPGENCPGDPPPAPPRGDINLGLAQFPSGPILPDRDLVVSFPVVVTSLNRNTTFGVVTSASYTDPLPTAMQATAMDENDREISNLVLPKTDGAPHTLIVKVRVKIPALAGAEAPANVVLGLTTPLAELRPSSGQVLFTIGKPAPASNPFSIDCTGVVNGDGFVDPQYGIVHLHVSDLVQMIMRADLSQVPAGEDYTLEIAVGDSGWQITGGLCPQMGGTCGSTLTLETPDKIRFYLLIQTPSMGALPPTSLDVTLRGTDPKHVATWHATITRS